MKKNQIILAILLFCSLSLSANAKGAVPFLEPNQIHDVTSQFQFNLILNENRNTPIVVLQYIKENTMKVIRNIMVEAFRIEPDIAFGVLINCNDFQNNLNKTLGICQGFQNYQEEGQEVQEQEGKINDPFFKLDFCSPNPIRIKEKGHLLMKNHDFQSLRDLNANFNYNFLAKVIKNQIPDLIFYIQDQHDLSQFMEEKTEFKVMKEPKIIFFDENLQSPLYLRKLAVKLDGWMKIGVTDNPRLAQKYKANFEEIVIFEFNIESNRYESTKITFDENDAFNSLLSSELIKSYTKILKPRDILLDFQHKKSKIYPLESIKQVNQLVLYGRIVILEISSQKQKYKCQKLKNITKQYQKLFNYVCFSQKNISSLQKYIKVQKIQEDEILFIDKNLLQAKVIGDNENLYSYLPQTPARQQISNQLQGDLCIKTAKVMKKQIIYYYFNEKTHKDSLKIVKYLNSLPQISSIIHFCQFYVPDKDVVQRYGLTENTIFTLMDMKTGDGRLQKIEHQKVDEFMSIKMFIRQIGISQIMKIYDQKLIRNTLVQITSSQELTKFCFSQKCIIGLIQTGKFHQKSELEMLQQMQVEFSEDGFKFYWIDGVCHWEIAKQLKITPKKEKMMDKSFIFLYSEKNNDYSLWKGNRVNKYWIKKQIHRWIKSLRNEKNIGRIKQTIDYEDKKCLREQIKTQKPDFKKTQTRKKDEVGEDEL